ncbi:MAG TPA: ArsR family transcriptional regulator [Tepidisphaeraceae bacterium]|nr:ArsR family transcriptional regulator [Tepidisphaeraceae bacterium]
MQRAEWHQRFFDSTRGRVLRALCGAEQTVNDLAELLQLTDNAVRSHLAALERDGLVRQSGLRRGTRKPNFAYDLTPAGHQFFPKAHGPVLQELLTVLGNELSEQKIEAILSEVALRLFATHLPGIEDQPPAERITRLLDAMRQTGALSDVQQEENFATVTGCSCPLSDVVASHPKICEIAANVLTQILGRPVTEHCQRSQSSRCCFHIATNS